MVVILVILACLVAGCGFVIVSQAVAMQNLRYRTAAEVKNANQTAQLLARLLQNPAPTTPPDELIRTIGDTIAKVVVGSQVQVDEKAAAPANEPTERYFPDVEFDEWLGTEGIPPTAGWWSPSTPLRDASNDNINSTNETPGTG